MSESPRSDARRRVALSSRWTTTATPRFVPGSRSGCLPGSARSTRSELGLCIPLFALLSAIVSRRPGQRPIWPAVGVLRRRRQPWLPWSVYNAGRFRGTRAAQHERRQHAARRELRPDLLPLHRRVGHHLSRTAGAGRPRARARRPPTRRERSKVRRTVAVEYIEDHLDRLPLVTLARLGRLVDVYGLDSLIHLDVGEEKAEWAVWAGHRVLVAARRSWRSRVVVLARGAASGRAGGWWFRWPPCWRRRSCSTAPTASGHRRADGRAPRRGRGRRACSSGVGQPGVGKGGARLAHSDRARHELASLARRASAARPGRRRVQRGSGLGVPRRRCPPHARRTGRTRSRPCRRRWPVPSTTTAAGLERNGVCAGPRWRPTRWNAPPTEATTPTAVSTARPSSWTPVAPIAAADRATVVLGVNTDDLTDHRPGQKAALQAGAVFPLVAGRVLEGRRACSLAAAVAHMGQAGGRCVSRAGSHMARRCASACSSTIDRAEGGVGSARVPATSGFATTATRPGSRSASTSSAGALEQRAVIVDADPRRRLPVRDARSRRLPFGQPEPGR